MEVKIIQGIEDSAFLSIPYLFLCFLPSEFWFFFLINKTHFPMLGGGGEEWVSGWAILDLKWQCD
jgi:hypothetical protein